MVASHKMIDASSTDGWRMSFVCSAMTKHDATSSGESQLCSMVWAHASKVHNRLCNEFISGFPHGAGGGEEGGGMGGT